MEIEGSSLKLVTPFTMLCAGATSSGKTFFIKNFLYNLQTVVDNIPKRILYCYGVYQPLFHEMEKNILNITFMHGLPLKDKLKEHSRDYENTLIILDDLMQEVYNSKDMLQLFTQFSHHNNISVIFTSQNIYHGGKYARSITLNCHYIVLFRNANLAQIRILGQQLFPGQGKTFLKIYEDAVQEKFAYLFLDLHPGHDTGNLFKLRSNIFPAQPMIVYQLD